MRKAMPWLYMIYPRDYHWTSVTLDNGSVLEMSLTGVTPDWRKRDWQYRLEGRYINEYDVENAVPVCLLIIPGAMDPKWRAVHKAFIKSWRSRSHSHKYFHDYASRNQIPLGTKIRAGRMVLTVVGILYEPPDEERFSFGRGAGNAIVPITTLQRLKGGDARVDEIVIDAGKASKVVLAKKLAQMTLESRHGPIKDINFEDYREALEVYLKKETRDAIATLALGLAALLAGGIGIMNVTLAIVFSRIKEIGIRRAIGATRGEIIMQFLTETLLLGFFGGLVGIVLGYYGVGNIMLGDFANTSKLTWWMPLLSVGVAMLACLVFSLLPAYRAAHLDPVVALRTE